MHLATITKEGSCRLFVIHFNGQKASNEDAANLVRVVDKVQAQQLNALTAFSDDN